jgi:hypothetical protein
LFSLCLPRQIFLNFRLKVPNIKIEDGEYLWQDITTFNFWSLDWSLLILMDLLINWKCSSQFLCHLDWRLSEETPQVIWSASEPLNPVTPSLKVIWYKHLNLSIQWPHSEDSQPDLPKTLE